MAKIHSAAWFDKWNARIADPINNTKRYYYRSSWIKIGLIIFLPFSIYWVIKGIIELVKLRKDLNSYFSLATDCLMQGRTITNDGAPGSGKTFTGSNMAYFLAQRRWGELKSEYFTQRVMVAEWIKSGDTDKLYAFKSLEDSYKFFAAQEGIYIPCLVSSVPLKEYGTGRTSYKLTPEVYLQITRCPEYSVLFNDESGMLYGGETSKTSNADIKDFWRLIRHFLDAMAINTNQDGNQNGIYMRRSTDFVNHLYGQEWDMRPDALLNKIERKENRFYKKVFSGKLSENKSAYIGQKLYFLKKYAATIGFRCVRHRLQTPQGLCVGDEEEYILPAIGGVAYDDRAYRNLYKPKDDEIRLEGWHNLVLDEYDRADYDKLINSSADE